MGAAVRRRGGEVDGGGAEQVAQFRREVLVQLEFHTIAGNSGRGRSSCTDG
jgi:hypothetical protein